MSEVELGGPLRAGGCNTGPQRLGEPDRLSGSRPRPGRSSCRLRSPSSQASLACSTRRRSERAEPTARGALAITAVVLAVVALLASARLDHAVVSLGALSTVVYLDVPANWRHARGARGARCGRAAAAAPRAAGRGRWGRAAHLRAPRVPPERDFEAI